jgi:TrpR family trp operon transcriptional repressor
MTKEDNYKNELAALLAEIKSPALMKEFLADLFTPSEFDDIATRLQVVKKLEKGESQRKIAEELGVGIATVTRGSRELRDKKGGFRKVLKGVNK